MASSLRGINKLQEVDYYLSKSFSIKINEKINVKQWDVTDGKIELKGEDPSPNIKKFTIGDKGKLRSDLGTTLDIDYPVKDNKNIIFKFVRNSGKNRFELTSAVIDTKPYALRFSEEPPYLTVPPSKPELIPNTEALAVPLSEVPNYPSQGRQVSTVSSSLGSVNQVSAGNRYGAVYISGHGLLSKLTVIEYIKYKNPNASPWIIEEIVNVYFNEAGKEVINTDLAIAQMCRTTNFLGIERIMKTCNFAGFASTPQWPGSFYGRIREGVIAHIQHLKGYTSNVRPSDLKQPLVDPRWNMLDGFRGTIHTLEDLSRKWAPYNSRGYENDIKNIINEMRRFSSWLDT
jgi:hypothetical protein